MIRETPGDAPAEDSVGADADAVTGVDYNQREITHQCLRPTVTHVLEGNELVHVNTPENPLTYLNPTCRLVVSGVRHQQGTVGHCLDLDIAADREHLFKLRI